VKRTILALAAATSVLAAATPAAAAALLPGTTGVTFTAFDASTRGEQLGFIESGTTGATTYTGSLRSAVYRNTLGTLDFYYQVAVSTIDANDEVNGLTGGGFAGYTVDAFVSTAAFGGFAAAANPQTQTNEASGFTSTAERSGGAGGVIRANFGANGLEAANQTSATYIYRTNAVSFNQLGTFTAQDGSVAQRANFQPIGAPVPEPATWGLMLMGFGMVGLGLRSRRSAKVAFA